MQEIKREKNEESIGKGEIRKKTCKSLRDYSKSKQQFI